MTAIAVITLLATQATGAASVPSESASSRAQGSAARVTAPVKPCKSARRAVVHYRNLTWERQGNRGGQLSDRTPVVRGKSCHWSRYAAGEHQDRAKSALKALERWQRVLSNPSAAICHVFGSYCSEALRVASCESGRGTTAQNGQYLGMFQMGGYARSRYGHSSTALGQARAAYAYFVDSGRDWSPWSCKP